jgi:Trypsin-like peptidase domain
MGAFSEINNKGTFNNPRGFSTGIIFDDEIIIELDAPSINIGNDIFEINNIVHGYFDVFNINRNKKARNILCEVNINCPEGNDWQKEKHGIAMMVIDGNKTCSGSLINNSCKDGKLLFLTANHCLGDLDAIENPDASTSYFVWERECSECITNENPIPITTNGATIIANDKASDFALLELIENPIDQNVPIYFNGWSTTNTPISEGVSIHHPLNDLKKISTFNNITNNVNGSNNAFWTVSWAQTITNWGVMHSGSSGAPLFMSNKKIIGQEFGGLSTCGGSIINLHDDFGKFSYSWDHSPIIKRQLKHWLSSPNCDKQLNEMDGGYLDYCLKTNIFINYPINNKKVFYSIDIITANDKITKSGNVEMYANNEIVLENGFDANLGSYANIEIRPCKPPMFIDNKKIMNNIDLFSKNFIPNDCFIFPNPVNNVLFIKNNGTNLNFNISIHCCPIKKAA